MIAFRGNVYALGDNNDVYINLTLIDAHNSEKTRPDDLTIRFVISGDEDNDIYTLKITEDGKIYHTYTFNDMVIENAIDDLVDLEIINNSDSSVSYILKYNWKEVFGSIRNEDVTFKVLGVSDNENYIAPMERGMILRENAKVNVEIQYSLKALKHVKGTVYYDDCDDRDRIRDAIYIGYDDMPNSIPDANIIMLEQDYYDKNKYTFETYLPIYYSLPSGGGPDFTRKIDYYLVSQIAEIQGDNFKVNIVRDEDYNLEYNVYITYEATKIDDVLVDVIWDDDNNKGGFRPSKLDVQALGINDVIEREFSINGYSYTLTDLFKRYEGKDINYTLRVEDVPNYEFIVTGNQGDGFTITGKLVKNPIVSEKEEENTSSNLNINSNNKDKPKEEVIKKDEIPETLDNILSYIMLFSITLGLIVGSLKKLKKKATM